MIDYTKAIHMPFWRTNVYLHKVNAAEFPEKTEWIRVLVWHELLWDHREFESIKIKYHEKTTTCFEFQVNLQKFGTIGKLEFALSVVVREREITSRIIWGRGNLYTSKFRKRTVLWLQTGAISLASQMGYYLIFVIFMWKRWDIVCCIFCFQFVKFQINQ